MDGAQRSDYYESPYPGLMTSSQAAVVASAAAADNHAPSSQRHQPPNDDELTLRVEDRERAPVATVTVGAIKQGSSGLLSRCHLPLVNFGGLY